MTQKEQLLKLFRDNGNMVTLGMILKTSLAAEYRARMSDLRRDGYDITCTINAKEPSENIYMLIEPQKHPLKLETVLDKQSYFEKDNVKPGLNWTQHSKPCSKCGSYYTINGKCNGKDKNNNPCNGRG